jgi:hypothetical protein
MPEYQIALREYLKIDSLIKEEDSLMQNELVSRISQFAIDSSKYSPLIFELRKKEIQDLTERYRQFNEAATEDLESRKTELLKPLKEKIATEASALGKEKGFTCVISESGYVERRVQFDDWTFYPGSSNRELCMLNTYLSPPIIYLDPKYKTVYITAMLIEKLE